jgi:hypothetical protein
MSGAKIIRALEDAHRGNFGRLTIMGETWVKLSSVTTMEDCVRQIVRDELVRSNLIVERDPLD